MPSRRSLLRGASIALATGSAGCFAGHGPVGAGTTASPTVAPPSATPPEPGTYADVPSGPEPYPERPADPTPKAVRSYVRSFEHAAVYNAIHEETDYGDVTEVSLNCEAVHDVAADGGHYALASCVGFANYETGVHADWGPRPALYYVGGDLTVRAGHPDRRDRPPGVAFAADDPSGNVVQPDEGQSAGFRVYNLDTRAHAVSVSVAYRGGLWPEEVFAAEYRLGAASGVRQAGVTYRRGEYRLRVRVDGSSATTARWTVDGGDGYGDQWTAVLVAPTGAVSVRRPAFGEL